MSVPITKPTFLAGTPRYSGAIQDGAVNMQSLGGAEAISRMSGLLVDLMLQSGGGRLNTIMSHGQTFTSGQIVFYDAHAVTSGGPFFASGHKILAIVPPLWVPGVSGVANPYAYPGFVNEVQVPFFSGLCVTQVSGQPGFTITVTRQVNNLDGGTVA